MVITHTVCCDPPLTLRLVSLKLSPHLPSLLPAVSSFPRVSPPPTHGWHLNPSLCPQPLHSFSECIHLPTAQIHKSSYKASILYHIQNLLFNPNLLCSYVFPSWPVEALTYTQSPGPQIQSHSAFLSLP